MSLSSEQYFPAVDEGTLVKNAGLQNPTTYSVVVAEGDLVVALLVGDLEVDNEVAGGLEVLGW